MSESEKSPPWLQEIQADDLAGPVFIVLTGNTKQDTLEPTVIGPFASLSEAKRFGVEHCREEVMQWPPGEGIARPAGFRVPSDGGYAGVVYVGAGLEDYSPEKYAEDYAWDSEKDDDTEAEDTAERPWSDFTQAEVLAEVLVEARPKP